MSQYNDLKAIQMIEFEILLELDRICKKHDIQYFLLAGTVLGAIRHKGFIPWDDDIDVGMMRDEYERFVKICSKEQDNKFFLQTNKTDPNFPFLFAKLRKNNTTFIEKAIAKVDMHKGVFIDIFPIDNIPNGKFARFVQKCLLLLLEAIRFSRTPDLYIGSKQLIKKLINFLHPCTRYISKRFTDNFEEKIVTMYNRKQTEYVGNIYGHIITEYNTKIIVKRDYFLPTSQLEFEGHYFPAPGKWHKYLTHLYNDYMKLPPEDQRMGHNILVFDSQTDYKEYNL